MKYPKSFQDLIDSFMLFPGIGPKSSERLAYFAITKLNKEQIEKISASIKCAFESIKKCSVCGYICEDVVCSICLSTNRENTLLILESPKEVNVFEKTNSYNGKYHVLNGLISPLNGVKSTDINIHTLKQRIKDENIEKVIIATSATIPGEATSIYIKNLLSEENVSVYRIGYGLPVGADIEYADSITLLKALEGIKKI